MKRGMNANNWSAAEIWTVAADRLKQKNELLYRQWFQNMTPLRLEENTLTLGGFRRLLRQHHCR
ncbi:MAG: hypothetical protein L6W00_29505 [Lentisphaeria bacterium]|nr:MAG: hypothetical protein L6W00_29505 [Lentisphaeria bacterium]